MPLRSSQLAPAALSTLVGVTLGVIARSGAAEPSVAPAADSATQPLQVTVALVLIGFGAICIGLLFALWPRRSAGSGDAERPRPVSLYRTPLPRRRPQPLREPPPETVWLGPPRVETNRSLG